jgi:hypothetical protein
MHIRPIETEVYYVVDIDEDARYDAENGDGYILPEQSKGEERDLLVEKQRGCGDYQTGEQVLLWVHRL